MELIIKARSREAQRNYYVDITLILSGITSKQPAGMNHKLRMILPTKCVHVFLSSGLGLDDLIALEALVRVCEEWNDQRVRLTRWFMLARNAITGTHSKIAWDEGLYCSY
jgi:hypothetical protein